MNRVLANNRFCVGNLDSDIRLKRKSMTKMDKVRPAQVFLSFASNDKASAHYIADALRRGGVSAWYDESDLPVGESLAQQIDDAGKSNDYLLILLSPDALNSKWLQHELDAALLRELKDRAIVIVPVLLADCEVPFLLRDRMYLDLRVDRDAGIQRLLSQLTAVPTIQFKNLSFQNFEQLVGDLLREMGFAIVAQGQVARDIGVDFKATFKTRDPFGTERNEVWLVGTKLYSNSRVSVTVLHQMVGCLATVPDVDMALVVTSGSITSAARAFLNKTGFERRIRVIEGPELTNLVSQYPSLVARYFGHGGVRA